VQNAIATGLMEKHLVAQSLESNLFGKEWLQASNYNGAVHWLPAVYNSYILHMMPGYSRNLTHGQSWARLFKPTAQVKMCVKALKGNNGKMS